MDLKSMTIFASSSDNETKPEGKQIDTAPLAYNYILKFKTASTDRTTDIVSNLLRHEE